MHIEPKGAGSADSQNLPSLGAPSQRSAGPEAITRVERYRAEQTARKEKVKAVLLDYIRRNDRLRAYQNIPAENLYQLFIDGDRWPITTTAAAVPASQGDPDLIFDRKEPGYMAAMMEAFIWMHDSHDPLSADFIARLHDAAVYQVGTVKIEADKIDVFHPGYRIKSDHKESFGVVREKTITQTGLAEMSARRKNDAYKMKDEYADVSENIFEVSMEDPSKTVPFAQPSGKSSSLPQFNMSSLTETDLQQIAKNLAIQAVSQNQENITTPRASTDSASERLVRGLTQEIMLYKERFFAYKDPRIILRSPPTNTYLPTAVNRFVELYNQADKSTETLKLKAIARLVQDLDQLHPFYDGNIRTFALLLMNKLLVDNGLSPSCMIDPNCTDGLSENELVEKIIEGQRQFQSLQPTRPPRLI